jgi:hypothetical protein
MTEGTKYHPLFEHLLFSGQGHLSMTFLEIEKVIGGSLPPSARRREEWWSNSPSGHSQARAWLRASYRTSHVDLANETVDFSLENWPEGYRRLRGTKKDGEVGQTPTTGLSEPAQSAYDPSQGSIRTHPLFGIWKGKVTLAPGYDYTKPVFATDDP